MVTYSSSVWDRLIAPIPTPAAERRPRQLTRAQYKRALARDLEALLNTRLTMPRPAAVTTMFSIDIESKAADLGLGQVQLDRLCIFVDAEASLCATKRDMLCMCARAACLGMDSICLALSDLPREAVGFAPNDAARSRDNLSRPAYLLLTAYFVNPEKLIFRHPLSGAGAPPAGHVPAPDTPLGHRWRGRRCAHWTRVERAVEREFCARLYTGGETVQARRLPYPTDFQLLEAWLKT